MDFVVSKVAMAVCALLIVALLAQSLDDSRFLDRDSEIRRVLTRLCALLERAANSGSELELFWEVPMMPTGAVLRVSTDGSLVTGESGGSRGYEQPACCFHTWAPLNRSLNRSTVEAMDRSAPVLTIFSGQTIGIRAVECVIDNSEEILVFLSCPHQDRFENLSASSLTDSVRRSASSFVL